LRIDVVNGKKNICYSIFGVYFVTGTKNPDISEKGTFRISKLIFYITTRGTLKDGQTQFLRIFLGTHIVSQVAVATMRKYLEKTIFQSSIFGAPSRLEPTTHRVVRQYWSIAPHADLKMVRSHIGHYNQ
jgi:hypothetical protein